MTMRIKIVQNTQEYNYTFQEVKNGSFKSDELSRYFVETLVFCQDWLNRKKEFILHTSGSTGKPKEIVIQRYQMQTSAQNTVQTLSLSRDLRALVCINTKYIGGKMMLVRGLEMNWELVIIEAKRNPLEVYLQGFDFTALVPLQLQTMLKSGNKEILKILDKMQAIIVGGAKVSEYLKEKIRILKNVEVYNTYGMTETVSHIALKKINAKKTEDYFEVLPNVEVDIDKRSCLKIRASVTKNKWIQTNDLVEILDKKHFKLLGRIDNVINTGGVKVQAEQVEKVVEKVLIELGKNIRFFVIGIPNQEFGEQVTLFLETVEVDKKSFLSSLKNHLSTYEIPKKIVCVSSFIETESGKVDKKASFSQSNII